MSKRKYRSRRKASDDEEDDLGESVSDKLTEARELQNIRKKPSGISATGLAYGKKVDEIEEKLAPDPFKLKTGGLVNLKELNHAEVEATDDEVVKRLTSQFSAETQTRDDETHMLKYIDDKMAEIKGKDADDRKLTDYEMKVISLYKMPERLKTKEKTQSEEMLSNQMLSGIPEVDLGLEAKFKNIEQTEEAKQKVIKQQLAKNTSRVSATANSTPSGYSHQSLRFYSDKNKKTASEEENGSDSSQSKLVYIPVVGSNDEPELKASVSGDGLKRKPDHTQLASDDYHYDKFKKKAKRY